MVNSIIDIALFIHSSIKIFIYWTFSPMCQNYKNELCMFLILEWLVVYERMINTWIKGSKVYREHGEGSGHILLTAKKKYSMEEWWCCRETWHKNQPLLGLGQQIAVGKSPQQRRRWSIVWKCDTHSNVVVGAKSSGNKELQETSLVIGKDKGMEVWAKCDLTHGNCEIRSWNGY